MTMVPRVAVPSVAEAALQNFAAEFDAGLLEELRLDDEVNFDPRWSRALTELRAYAARPAKRVRPTLLVTGWALAQADVPTEIPEGVRRFATGLELLHTFMLIHDDVADCAAVRRGGPALHTLLGRDKVGDDLAVVVGDHLYARAVETMLASGLPTSAEATRYMMAICRHTAAGQFLDLELSRAPLRGVTLGQTLKVAELKTARYGFVAPLVAGAMLGGGSPELIAALERVGRQVGIAFQLRDDLIGLFGDDALAGKDGGGDFVEGKRTFPLVAALTRADAAGRERLEALWAGPKNATTLQQAREELDRHGGRAATERVIARATRTARAALATLPAAHGARGALDGLMARLQRRNA